MFLGGFVRHWRAVVVVVIIVVILIAIGATGFVVAKKRAQADATTTHVAQSLRYSPLLPLSPAHFLSEFHSDVLNRSRS